MYLDESAQEENKFNKLFIDRDRRGKSTGTVWITTTDKTTAEVVLRFHYSKIGDTRVSTLLMGFTYETEEFDGGNDSDDDEINKRIRQIEIEEIREGIQKTLAIGKDKPKQDEPKKEQSKKEEAKKPQDDDNDFEYTAPDKK